jgi:hypothetical protein
VSPRTIRWLVIVVFVGGIAGMIVGSIADDNGVAITFGLITAVAALGLILVTAVTSPAASGTSGTGGSGSGSGSGSSDRPDPVAAEEAGAAVEEQVDRLVGAGAEEREVRELVRRAVRFGRTDR